MCYGTFMALTNSGPRLQNLSRMLWKFILYVNLKFSWFSVYLASPWRDILLWLLLGLFYDILTKHHWPVSRRMIRFRAYVSSLTKIKIKKLLNKVRRSLKYIYKLWNSVTLNCTIRTEKFFVMGKANYWTINVFNKREH